MGQLCRPHSAYHLNATDGNITTDDIRTLSDSAFDDLKFVYMGACKTGEGGSAVTNLVATMYNKGADAVLGFTHSVDIAETNYWSEVFLISLAEGNTIADAMEDADTALRVHDTLGGKGEYSVSERYRYIKGSTTMIPCP